MNRYEVIKPIGSGAFGSVLKCREKTSNEVVAVKQMHRKYMKWEDCVHLKEVKSLIAMSHPNIIRLKEVFRQQNELYFVFEFADGGSFFDLVERRRNMKAPLSLTEVQSLMGQVMQGLDHMHAHGFFHRDIKPENILLSGGVAKLADLGLAREIRYVPPLTEYVSTRWYRAPEILLRSPVYGPPIDMWAIGCVAYELYTGRPLFPGTSEADVLHRISAAIGNMETSGWEEGLGLARRLKFRFPATGVERLGEMYVRDQDIMSEQAPYLLERLKDFVRRCIRWNPKERITAREALRHPFLEVKKDDMVRQSGRDSYTQGQMLSSTVGSCRSSDCLVNGNGVVGGTNMSSSSNGQGIGYALSMSDIGGGSSVGGANGVGVGVSSNNNGGSGNIGAGRGTQNRGGNPADILSDGSYPFFSSSGSSHIPPHGGAKRRGSQDERTLATRDRVNREMGDDFDIDLDLDLDLNLELDTDVIPTGLPSDAWQTGHLSGSAARGGVGQVTIGTIEPILSPTSARSQITKTRRCGGERTGDVAGSGAFTSDDYDMIGGSKYVNTRDRDDLTRTSVDAVPGNPQHQGKATSEENSLHHSRKASHTEALDMAKNALKQSRSDHSSRGSSRSGTSSIDELLNDNELWE